MNIHNELQQLKSMNGSSKKSHKDLEELIKKVLPLISEMRSELQLSIQILELRYGRILDITKVVIIASIPALLALLTTDLSFVKAKNLLFFGVTLLLILAVCVHAFVINKIVNATDELQSALTDRASLLSGMSESYLNGAKAKDLARDIEKLEHEISKAPSRK